MALVAVLPRGINLGARNTVSMPGLREALTGAGFERVATYAGSGNVVVEAGGRTPDEVAAQVRAVMAACSGVDVLCLARTRDEVDATVAADPLGDRPEVAGSPSRHYVVFLPAAPDPAAVAAVDHDAALPELVAFVGRDVHTWHPEGLKKSTLDPQLSRLGIVGTARNWRTVLRLQEMLAG